MPVVANARREDAATQNRKKLQFQTLRKINVPSRVGNHLPETTLSIEGSFASDKPCFPLRCLKEEAAPDRESAPTILSGSLPCFKTSSPQVYLKNIVSLHWIGPKFEPRVPVGQEPAGTPTEEIAGGRDIRCRTRYSDKNETKDNPPNVWRLSPSVLMVSNAMFLTPVIDCGGMSLSGRRVVRRRPSARTQETLVR